MPCFLVIEKTCILVTGEYSLLIIILGEVYMKIVKDFLEMLQERDLDYTEKCKKKKLDLNHNILLSDNVIACLVSCIENLKRDGQDNDVEKRIYDILRNPTPENGIVYETLVYDWLYKHYVGFEIQPHIGRDDCFKESLNGYDADGKIDNTIFDVKTFSFGMPRYQELQRTLNTIIKQKCKERVNVGISSENKTNEIYYGNYYITISGNADLSSDMFEQKYLGKETEIFKRLFDEKNQIFKDYILKDQEFYIEIRAHYRETVKSGEIGSRTRNNIYTAISEFDPAEWAWNNQYQLLRHGSQFCRPFPYIVICPYDNYKCNKVFGDKDRYLTFRFLCRRMFMSHTKMENRYLHEFDGKAQRGVSVADAARKLSAVLFLEVSQEEGEMTEGYLYVNPNADNSLERSICDIVFRSNGICVDDFRYDNY